jgi:uncharacterized membrane protein YhaH (DUF805 family)
MHLFNLFFSFKGRITRSQYWLAGGSQFAALIMLVFGLISSLGISASELSAQREAMNPEILAKVGTVALFLILGMIVIMWSAASVYTKRLHDRDKGAIWLLGIYGPAFGSLVFPPLIFLSFISNIWVFVELGCMPGTPGPNRFDGTPSSAYLDDAFGSKPTKAGATGAGSYGGMEAAMAAVTAAARAAPAPQSAYRAASNQSGSQFGGNAPQGFGRKNVSQTSGGFGRR